MDRIKNKYIAIISLVLTSLGFLLLLGFVPANHHNIEFVAKITGINYNQVVLPFISPELEDSSAFGKISKTEQKQEINQENNSFLQIEGENISFFDIKLAPHYMQNLSDEFFVANLEKINLAAQICLYSKPEVKKAKVDFNFANLSMRERSKNYSAIVDKYSAQYNLSNNLVLAIMQVESGFNPNLVSNRQAHGLMQVVPNSAGGDVHKFFGKSGNPSPESLLDPSTNIKYGTAYLSMLERYYFSGINDPQSKEYCIIAAYNLGPNALLSSFGKTPTIAIANINEQSSEEILYFLQNKLYAKETRHFVKKVLNAQNNYPSDEREMQGG